METLRALIRGDLAPAGYPVVLEKSSAPEFLFTRGYQTHWLDSGTSALALALLDCKLRHSQVDRPQVIIPGYCCPDLVAAAVFAGVEPLAVDIQENDPSYDLTQLQSALSSRVIAVIAINFLGLRERLTEIREIIARHETPVCLIEDNAQWFPDDDNQTFESDYVVFSFGRGKPLSLLGGGALLAKKSLDASITFSEGGKFSFKSRMKMRAYNALLHPHLYCFLNRAPFLHLGETRYHPLTGIEGASDSVNYLFANNYRAYQQRSRHQQTRFQSAFQSGVQQLDALSSNRYGRLLRYPLLLPSAEKCSLIYQSLSSAGLGASRLYQESIDKVEGVAGKLQCFSDLPNARKFASRLLTLPVHGFVKDKHIEHIIEQVFLVEN
jgi:dTDP-4-amino-4,6-dideoxygalactose transaminase